VDTDGRKFVVFRLGVEEYGLPIDKVKSVIRFEKPTPVPRAPKGVEGVINLRGQVVPVVDLGKRLLGTVSEESPTSRIVIAETRSGLVGLVVDRARDVATFSAEDIRPTPETALTAETADAFEGVVSRDERLVILLDLDHALSDAGLMLATAQEGMADA